MHHAIIFVLFLFSFNAWTQEATRTVEESVEESPTEAENVEKIEVTGSHIKQVDLEGRTPVQTLDREYLEKTGYNSVGDVLRELSANSFGSARERSGSSTGSSTGSVTEVSLRGLGANRTLVLINGRRIAKDGTTGSADLNLIPLAATERIDVLKDSSSAIYGTDAIGGVVNIITKKNFNGVELSASQSVSSLKGGNKTTVSGTAGWSKGKTRLLTTLQYRNNGEIFARDRDWLHTGNSVHSPVPNVIYGDVPSPRTFSHCPSYRSIGKLQVCNFRWTNYATETPRIKQFNLYTQAEHQLNASTQLYFEFMGSYKEFWSQYAPGAVRLVEEDNALKNNPDNNFIKNIFGNDVESVKIMWRALMLGPRISDEKTTSFRVNTGVSKYLGETWETQLSLGTERIKRDHQNPNGYAKATELTEALQNGVSASGTECNIFEEGGTCNIKSDVAYAPYQIMHSDLHTLELKGSGEVMELPHGALMAAVGTQLSFEKFSDDYDDLSIAGGVLGGGAGAEGKGDRQVRAFFTEFSMPVLKNMEVNLAGRYDHYSDFGGTFNPKLSLMYRPTSKLLLRASTGTGFKAPDMNVIYAQESLSYPIFVDAAGCARGVEGACAPDQYGVRTKRPKGLKEETSTNANIGAVYQASQSMSVGFDVFYTHIKDSIGTDPQTDLVAITEAELAGVDLARYHTKITRDNGREGRIETIETQSLNIAQTRINGADLELKYKRHFRGVGTVAVNNNTSYIFQFKSQGFPGTPFKSVLGDNGKPHWRNMLTVGYAPADSFQLSTTFATTGKHAQMEKGTGDIDTHTAVHAQAGYHIGRKWGKVTLGVENLWGHEPPLDSSNPDSPVTVALYSNRGRTFTLGYTVSF